MAEIKPGNLKAYRGNLSLDWYGKDYSIIQGAEEHNVPGMVPPPILNWVNDEGSAFYLPQDDKKPLWVHPGDIRVHEARPLEHRKTYTATAERVEGTLGVEFDQRYNLSESEHAAPTPTANLLIKGDNLLALNTLKKDYAKQVKCVFLDPPYNTESAFIHYDDNLEHSVWLTLVRDRLALIRELVSDDGSVWMTVDDNEAHYLKIVCDQVFGRQNYVTSIVWEKDKGRRSDTVFSTAHDYIFIYAKTASEFAKTRNLIDRTDGQVKRYRNPDNDPNGPWLQGDNGTAKSSSDASRFEITLPSGRVVVPPPGRGWAFSPETFETARKANRVYFGRSGDGQPIIKRYLSEVQDGVVPRTWWPADEFGHNQEAKRDHLNKLLPDIERFATPKPERLIGKILEIATSPGDLVLDSFGGSGTTGAVAHKMGRRWIMVEQGDHCDTHIIPRLKKVLSGEDQGGISTTSGWNGGGSFTYYHLGDSILKVDDNGWADLNWAAGRAWLEGAILSAYDFRPALLETAELVAASALAGIRSVKGGAEVALVSLWAPGEPEARHMLPRGEWDVLYQAAKKLGSKVFLFTNRGLELAGDSKPDDLTVVRVPEALVTQD